MRSAGTVHVAPSRSISSHVALRTSAERGRGEHQELERELRRFARPCAAAHLRDTLGHVLVRERGHMPAASRPLRGSAASIATPAGSSVRWPWATAPPADRRDALLHAPRRLALLVPDGLDDGHDVARRDLGHRQRAPCSDRRRSEGSPSTAAPDFGLRQLGAWMAMTASAASANVGAGGRLPASRGVPAPPSSSSSARRQRAPRASARPIAGVVPDAVVGALAPDAEPLDPHLRAPRGDAQAQPCSSTSFAGPLAVSIFRTVNLPHSRTTIRTPIDASLPDSGWSVKESRDTDKRIFIR